LADESADISGTEQLSVGVRYLGDDGNGAPQVREEFLGFVPLTALDAASVSDALLGNVRKWNLIDHATMVGQGYDGCSTMAGCVNGVQTRVRAEHPSAVFSHCASHRLNLVINKTSTVTEIRNCVGTIKSIVSFFRESPLRRKLVTNIPLLCETRSSAKYKSIRLFTQNLVAICDALEHLSGDATSSTATRTSAFQLHSAVTRPSSIISALIIGKYSAILEPVANALQGVSVDLAQVQKHAETLIEMFEDHRKDSGRSFDQLFIQSEDLAAQLGVALIAPPGYDSATPPQQCAGIDSKGILPNQRLCSVPRCTAERYARSLWIGSSSVRVVRPAPLEIWEYARRLAQKKFDPGARVVPTAPFAWNRVGSRRLVLQVE
jgi:hypothetical protein